MAHQQRHYGALELLDISDASCSILSLSFWGRQAVLTILAVLCSAGADLDDSLCTSHRDVLWRRKVF
jgi:hypothetical protein